MVELKSFNTHLKSVLLELTPQRKSGSSPSLFALRQTAVDAEAHYLGQILLMKETCLTDHCGVCHGRLHSLWLYDHLN